MLLLSTSLTNLFWAFVITTCFHHLNPRGRKSRSAVTGVPRFVPPQWCEAPCSLLQNVTPLKNNYNYCKRKQREQNDWLLRKHCKMTKPQDRPAYDSWWRPLASIVSRLTSPKLHLATFNELFRLEQVSPVLYSFVPFLFVNSLHQKGTHEVIQKDS